MKRILALLTIAIALPLAAQETEYVSATSVNSSPFVCYVDGVAQSGTHSQTHTAAARVINLKIANPDAAVECTRQQTLRGDVSLDDLRNRFAGEGDADPDSPIAEASDPAIIYVVEPTRNTDGTLLTDLETVRIAYSASESGPFDTIADLPAPLTEPTEIDGLPAGVGYFVAYAINSRGTVSDPSNVVSRVLE